MSALCTVFARSLAHRRGNLHNYFRISILKAIIVISTHGPRFAVSLFALNRQNTREMEISDTIKLIKQGKIFEFPIEFQPSLLEYFQKRLEAELLDIQNSGFPKIETKLYVKNVIEYTKDVDEASLTVQLLELEANDIHTKQARLRELEEEYSRLQTELEVELSRSKFESVVEMARKEFTGEDFVQSGISLIEAQKVLESLECSELKSGFESEISTLSTKIRDAILDDFSNIIYITDDCIQISPNISKYSNITSLSTLYTIPISDSVYQMLSRQVIEFCVRFIATPHNSINAIDLLIKIVPNDEDNEQDLYSSLIQILNTFNNASTLFGNQPCWYEYLSLNCELLLFPAIVEQMKSQIMLMDMAEKGEYFKTQQQKCTEFDDKLKVLGLSTSTKLHERSLSLYQEFANQIVNSIVSDAKTVIDKDLTDSSFHPDLNGYLFHTVIINTMQIIASKILRTLPQIE